MKLDTTTSDYKQDALSDTPERSLAEAAYLRLATQKGSLFSDPEFGSELYKLARAKDTTRAVRLAHSYAKEALEPMRAIYYLTEIEVTAFQPAKGFVRTSAQLFTSEKTSDTVTIDTKVSG